MRQRAEQWRQYESPPDRRRALRALECSGEGEQRVREFPYFDLPLAPSGYAWWYLDALSDDGAHGLTLIAFLGSVFSPYYAFARRRGRADPFNHCAVNIALYGSARRWAMTERSRGALERDQTTLRIGPSSLRWEGRELVVDIAEIAAPIPSHVRGQVRFKPRSVTGRPVKLDAKGRHVWWPVAPHARVEVTMDQPDLSWQGSGYLDHNTGSEPLEDAFVRWDWSRSVDEDGTTVVYDLSRRDGSDLCLAARCNRWGRVQTFDPPAATRLPRTGWRVERRARVDAEGGARVLDTLEDTPFYARSLIAAEGTGTSRVAVHESLSLDRFRSPVVQLMLPFRMPRRRNGQRHEPR